MIEISNTTRKLEWYPFFSQTGTELTKIIQLTGIEPTKIITNLSLQEAKIRVNPWLYQNYGEKFVYVSNRPSEDDYIDAIGFSSEDKILTMHGWLRIVPSLICNKYKTFNGHPGLITKFPELKGKDPQMKAYLGNYTTGGCVIHEITPVLDDGPILLSKEISIKDLSLDKTFLKLYETSLELWIQFFKELKW